MCHAKRQDRRSECGAIVLHAFLAMGVVFGVGALAVDLGMLVFAQNELETVADAAALAGAKELPFGRTERAVRQAVVYGERNRVLGQSAILAGENDVALGEWDFQAGTFVENGLAPNAVRVSARRATDAGTAPISTWFATMFGVGEVDVGMQSTAVALSRDVVIVIDRSGSMGDDPRCALDPTNTGIVGAREAAIAFLRDIARSTLRDRIGIVSFAHRARVEERILDLDQRLPRLVEALENLEAEECGMLGGTNTGEGIDYARELYEQLGGRGGRDAVRQHVIILVSDGIANRVRGQDWEQDASREDAHAYTMEAARDAADRGIVIHTIALGLNGQFGDMREVAEATGGRYFLAPEPQDLESLFLALSHDVRVALVD